MTEKQEPDTAAEELIDKMRHRVSLLTTTDKELNEAYTDQKKTLAEQQILFEEELHLLREEIQQLQHTMQELRKAIFGIGHQLKTKVPTPTLNALQEKIDSWKLEEYITKKEVPELFEKYVVK
ncbi:hypothetical protein K9M74_03550 [Candidatus Woesearchaeota archaeon]|nr:hypothetical protein [Candidatus Woesearchaeota archaeon]